MCWNPWCVLLVTQGPVAFHVVIKVATPSPLDLWMQSWRVWLAKFLVCLSVPVSKIHLMDHFRNHAIRSSKPGKKSGSTRFNLCKHTISNTKPSKLGAVTMWLNLPPGFHIFELWEFFERSQWPNLLGMEGTLSSLQVYRRKTVTTWKFLWWHWQNQRKVKWSHMAIKSNKR